MNNSSNEHPPYLIHGWAIVGYDKEDPRGIILEITSPTTPHILEKRLAGLQKNSASNLLEYKLEYISGELISWHA